MVPAKPAPPLPPPPKPAPLLLEEFVRDDRAPERWAIGVLATSPETFDAEMITDQTDGVLRILPRAGKDGTRFNGYISTTAFDLRTTTIATEIRRPAAGRATTIFAAAIDSENWIGFRIEGGQLSLESHTSGQRAARKVTYDSVQHRFLRLRTSSVAPVVVWETSANGRNWNPEYVETATINVTALRIALSAGTTSSVETAGAAEFDDVTVERKP